MKRSLALAVGALVLSVLVVGVVAGSAAPAALRTFLTGAQFWFLELQFAALVATTALVLPGLFAALKPPPQALVATAVISLTTVGLAGGMAPRTNRLFYDEHIYESIGQNLADLHRAQMCLEGNVEYGALDCARAEYNKQPYGYPYLLSLGYRAFGVSESIAHRLNVASAGVAAWAAFVAALLLFGDAVAAVFAAIVFMLIPQQLLWAHTAAAEPTSALTALLAVTAGLAHARLQTTRSLAWMVAAMAFAAQFRIEALLVVPVVAVTLVLLAPSEFARPRTWWGATIGLWLCAALVFHIAAVRGESWGASGDRLSLVHVLPNLASNGRFYLADPRFPASFTVLALAGMLWRPARTVLIPAVLFLAFWGTYLFFYAGSYDFGADVRFSLMTYPALALLAGRGLSVLLALAQTKVPAPRAAGGVLGLLVLQFLWFTPQVRAIGAEAWAARADVAFAREVIPTLPPNSIVLTHNPSIFHVNGLNAAQMSLVTTDRAWVVGHLPTRYAGGVYLHWNAWCGYEDRSQQALCESVLKSFTSELVAEYHERSFRYAFYKLEVAGTVPKVAP